MKKLWARIKAKWRSGNKAEITAPAMSAEKLLEVFAVDPETPLLLGVLAVLAGNEERAVESVMGVELKDSERSGYAGEIRGLAEAQERIIELVQKGNDAKQGRKTSDKQPDVEALRSRLARITGR